MTAFETKLAQYAHLTVHVGLNLQPGQRLFLGYNTPLEAAPLVRLIAASAYQAGSPLVEVLWRDEEVLRLQFLYAPPESFAEFPQWRAQAGLEFAARGDARLQIGGDDPDLFHGQDLERVATFQRTALEALRPVSQYILNAAQNWCVVAVAGSAWAAKVFPDLPPHQQVERLWQAIFDVCRLNEPDPVAAWRAHIDSLLERSAFLNARHYAALRFTGPGTDLRVGLPEGHVWNSAQATTTSGIVFTPNIPTEEVFTMPHRDQVDGVVASTMPLSYGGTLIEDIRLEFRGGRVVGSSASRSETVLRQVLAADDGALHLGEVALVPHSSPIARQGRLFYRTLFDENAASHIALGSAYKLSVAGGQAMTDDEFAAAGGNRSVVHLDFMIGSGQVDVDGLRADGTAEPLMRAGEWVSAVSRR
jgi:aminopeptidase